MLHEKEASTQQVCGDHLSICRQSFYVFLVGILNVLIWTWKSMFCESFGPRWMELLHVPNDPCRFLNFWTPGFEDVFRCPDHASRTQKDSTRANQDNRHTPWKYFEGEHCEHASLCILTANRTRVKHPITPYRT